MNRSLHNPHLEKIGLGIIAFAFLTINLLFVTRIPKPWIDEVMYADPAVNWLMGNGFTSTAWYAQTGDKFWAGNPPLYGWLLTGWMKLIGFSLTSVRLFSYCLTLVSGLILWSVAKREQLMESAITRVSFLTLLLTGFGMSWTTRATRPDGVSILLFSLIVLSFFRKGPGRWLALGVLGFLIPFVQLQALAFLALFVALVFLFLRGRVWKESVVLGGSSLLGVGALLLLYRSQGVLGDFWKSIRIHTTVGKSLAHPLSLHLANLGSDISCLLVIAASLAALLWKRTQRNQWDYFLLFGVVQLVVIQFALTTLGKFHFAYTWMVWLPLAFCACVGIEHMQTNGSGKRVALSLLALATLGMPARLVWGAKKTSASAYGNLGEKLKPLLRKEDIVFADWSFYYIVKPAVAKLYLPNYPRSAVENESVTLVVIPRSSSLPNGFAGKWAPFGEPFGSADPGIQFGPNDPTFQAYRRVN